MDGVKVMIGKISSLDEKATELFVILNPRYPSELDYVRGVFTYLGKLPYREIKETEVFHYRLIPFHEWLPIFDLYNRGIGDSETFKLVLGFIKNYKIIETGKKLDCRSLND